MWTECQEKGERREEKRSVLDDKKTREDRVVRGEGKRNSYTKYDEKKKKQKKQTSMLAPYSMLSCSVLSCKNPSFLCCLVSRLLLCKGRKKMTSK